MRIDVYLHIVNDHDHGGHSAPLALSFGPVTARPVSPSPMRVPRMAFALQDDQQTVLHAHATDAAGNALPSFATPPTWAVDKPDVLTITPSADGASCTVVTTGTLGDAVVTVTADGKTDDFPITVSTDPAVSGINVTADPPTSRMGGDANPAPDVNPTEG